MRCSVTRADPHAQPLVSWLKCDLLCTGQTVMGGVYQLYFLQDKQDNTIAVVLPTNATQNVTPVWQEVNFHFTSAGLQGPFVPPLVLTCQPAQHAKRIAVNCIVLDVCIA